ncbi:hypothetical protein F2Q68_00019671 [Brassica cretica]|uniref:Uncharacterized protein n=1 Tax=Brassica cretica TaxID=69181 RepID=A0A8S9G0A4_BRACR|nr:hypothetical protein F2Q68_00019671 [Brassica cretica]
MSAKGAGPRRKWRKRLLPTACKISNLAATFYKSYSVALVVVLSLEVPEVMGLIPHNTYSATFLRTGSVFEDDW